MNFFKRVFAKLEKFGLFVSDIINYILLIVVYIIGVSLTWCIVRISKKELLRLNNLSNDSNWHDVPKNNNSLERARRMF